MLYSIVKCIHRWIFWIEFFIEMLSENKRLKDNFYELDMVFKRMSIFSRMN